MINSFFTFSFQFENLMDDVSKTLIHNIFWYTFKCRYICNVAISVSHLSETLCSLVGNNYMYIV